MNAWQTPLISAGTALAVTLLVEYAAKPGLEARKDRILAERRTLKSFQSALRKVQTAATKFGGVGQSGRARVVKLIEELSADLTEEVASLSEHHLALEAKLPDDLKPFVGDLVYEVNNMNLGIRIIVKELPLHHDDGWNVAWAVAEKTIHRIIALIVALKGLTRLRNGRLLKSKRRSAIRAYETFLEQQPWSLESIQDELTETVDRRDH